MNRPLFAAIATLVGSGLLTFYLAGCFFGFVSAESDCCNPPTFPLSYPRFAPNSSVTVTISSAFTPTERQSIITALGDWNTANASNGSGVTFVLPPLTGETPVRTSGNQFIGYDPNRSGAENPMDSAGYAIMLLGTSIRTGGTPEGRAAYTRGMVRHEVGHTLGLANRLNCNPANCSVMCTPAALETLVITDCDNTTVGTAYPSPTPNPTPTPTPTPTPCPCNNCDTGCCDPALVNDCRMNAFYYVLDGCYCDNGGCQPGDGEPQCIAQGFGCGSFVDFRDGRCKPAECLFCYANEGSHCSQSGDCWTPIVIDLSGDGFDLTSGLGGVWFRPTAGDEYIHTAWTSTNSDDAFLVLDRNANGFIDNGTELFGCSTPQPQPPPGVLRNGFLALAEYDKPANGGNSNGRIGPGDGIYGQLKLWRDLNHNGLSESSELQLLSQSEVRTIDLDYRESRREDQHGNKFKYRARVRDRWGAQVGRWAWDVFPVVHY